MDKGTKLTVIAVILSTLLIFSVMEYVQAGWFGDKKGEQKVDVWQESCNEVILLKDNMSCQQANFIIKQNAKIIELLEKSKP